MNLLFSVVKPYTITMIDDEKIVKYLQSGPKEHDMAISYLFTTARFKVPIISFLKMRGLSNNETNLLWTDIIVKFGILVKSGKYEHQGKLLAYIKNLSNYMLLNYFRDNKKSNHAELKIDIVEDSDLATATMYHKELKTLLDKQLSFIGEICKNTLFLWSKGYSMKEIMHKLSFVSLESTRKRKHTCLKKLLKLVEDNEGLSKTLKDYHNLLSS